MALTIPSPSFLAETGHDVDLFLALSELTVVQAAKFLDVSQGFVNELLDFNILKFREDAGCRLIKSNDLIEYGQERKRGHALLDEMVRLNQEMGLYDD
jgi:predicted XRE-type DNA-binding protein